MSDLAPVVESLQRWADLATITPSRTFYRAAWGHYRESYTFYILPPGLTDCADVPVRGVLGVVYSPSNYASPGYQDGWVYVRLRVTPEHAYAQESKRDLTDEEQAHFEALIAAHKQSIQPEALSV